MVPAGMPGICLTIPVSSGSPPYPTISPRRTAYVAPATTARIATMIAVTFMIASCRTGYTYQPFRILRCLTRRCLTPGR